MRCGGTGMRGNAPGVAASVTEMFLTVGTGIRYTGYPRAPGTPSPNAPACPGFLLS